MACSSKIIIIRAHSCSAICTQSNRFSVYYTISCRWLAEDLVNSPQSLDTRGLEMMAKSEG